jgi:hypothetical protein
MSAIANVEPRDEGAPSTNTVLLVARLLTALRLLTIGCVVIILTALAQQGITSLRWCCWASSSCSRSARCGWSS